MHRQNTDSTITTPELSWAELLSFNQSSQQEKTIVCLVGRFFLVCDLAHQALNKLIEHRVSTVYQETFEVLCLTLSTHEATQLTDQLFTILTPETPKTFRQQLWSAMKKGLIRIPLWIPSLHLTEVLNGKVLRPWTIWSWFTLCLLSILIAIKNGLVTPADPLHLTVMQFALLWIAMTLTTMIHEFGHFAVAAHYGVRTRSLGIALFYLQPAAYADVTEAWIKPKNVRIAVALGGIGFQSIPVAIGAILWAFTSAPLLGLYCVANLVMILFNLIPFARLDGYFILSHLLQQHNLRQRSISHLTSFFKRNNKREFRGAASGLVSMFAIFSLTFAAGLYLSVVTGFIRLIAPFF
jgi:Zn-dependent protease